MEMEVVIDEVWAEEAEEFAGAVVAAVGGVERALACAVNDEGGGPSARS